MNERTIFMEALDKDDPTERSVFLDTACAGDDALRQRVEALLESHVEAGNFLDKLAPDRLAEELAIQHKDDDTQGEVPENNKASEDLDFLTPADKPGVLGRLAHYDILEVIGRGGMGIVLRAFDEKLHRVVAIKVMAAQLATNATARKRFSREAQSQAAVSHDHIVTIHAVEEANGLPYLVMHYVAGMSLQERLDKSGALQLHEILRIGMQTASGLAAAHAQGLIHRDIKPSNILLENGVERVKVTDFGLARAATEANLTQSGVVAGTPQYMSPEQAEGKAIDQRTDLFSLGSVLYAMCAGRAPFRASGTMAILKRVCEQKPTAIRESNADIPEWLVAIIDKLHAKDPAERYQSAAEVAELLGRHLAHVQHPSVVKQVSALSSEPKAGLKHAPRRRLAIAAAVLLCLVGSLAFTEATGVTKLRSTVIRILTPDGTLVVEVDDPGVKVTIEGDGGLVITGAGLEEIRLRPGSYKVHADRDGKRVPLERELVSIAKGGREVVKVKLETPPAPALAKTEKGAFVLLAGGKERTFKTLAEAVSAAYDGDTIEVRGNGPFVTEPITIGNGALTIRAGSGFRPVIKSSTRGDALHTLRSQGRLVLEGLELHLTGANKSTMVHAEPGPLHVTNCRFVLRCEGASLSRAFGTVRNCEFVSAPNAYVVLVYAHLSSDGTMLFENNVFSSPFGHAFGFVWYGNDLHDAEIQLKHNTVATKSVTFDHSLREIPQAARPDAGSARPPLRMHATANLFDHSDHTFTSLTEDNLSVKEAERMLPRLMDWREERNLYGKGMILQWLVRLKDPMAPKREQISEPLPACQTLADWQRFWKAGDSGSTEGVIRYEGGDVYAKLKADPERVTAADFRLRKDSAGYRAGKDGKDLGADVDLVGPGPAYERWKKTPEYQQWLKDSGQVKK